MTFEFAKYSDGTLGAFSNIAKKDDGSEYLRVTFERPKEYGFDTYIVEFAKLQSDSWWRKLFKRRKRKFYENCYKWLSLFL